MQLIPINTILIKLRDTEKKTCKNNNHERNKKKKNITNKQSYLKVNMQIKSLTMKYKPINNETNKYTERENNLSHTINQKEIIRKGEMTKTRRKLNKRL